MNPQPLAEIARDAVLYQYAARHDLFAEQEQVHLLTGHEIEAAGARVYALLLLRAWKAERDDPEPLVTA